MGLLDKLWDETLAGPTPDSGLGKLRKYNSFSASLPAAPPPQIGGKVSPSIPIPGAGGGNNNYRNLTVSVDSPSSPSSSSAPNSPFSPNTPGAGAGAGAGAGGNLKKFARRKSSAAAAMQSSVPKSPTGYDWIVLSALDR